MGNGDDGHCVFSLTSLQIGDLQSYLSDLNLFLAIESNKFYILVDNRPWLRDLGSRSAHLWQLMVTKSRLSPFANSKARRERKGGEEASSNFTNSKPKKYQRWCSLINAARSTKKNDLLPVKKLRDSLLLSGELHTTLYGFIVFEVSWTNVRGINYFNELQTDTSLAIETRFMKRWEFDNISQAASSISSWFPGTQTDQRLLKEYLDSVIGDVFYDAEEDFSSIPFTNVDQNICNANLCVKDCIPHFLDNNVDAYCVTNENTTYLLYAPPPSKRRKIIKSFNGVEVDIYCEEMETEFDDEVNNSKSSASHFEHALEITQYSDVLILFRFNDPYFPFKLRQIIMSNLRLLTLLEAGLPSWVIFLQSYPGFRHMYRPWMCPLVRYLYVLISVATVLVGFYDLYKNVPVLKATASRLCGPLLDWVETWEMISRVQCLGTMLFLHNLKKAIKWFLAITHTTRSFFSVLIQPVVDLFGFLSPICNECIKVAEGFCSIIWIVVAATYDLVDDLIKILLFPIWFIISFIWSIATLVIYPLVLILWEIIYAPIRVVFAFSSFVGYICTGMFDLAGRIWQSVSGIVQLVSTSEAAVTTYEVSLWRSLWNDLFSQIFRALRSILNGFVAFFTACNRHRLSIYNHVVEFIRRLFGRALTSPADLRNSRPKQTTRHLPEGRTSVFCKDETDAEVNKRGYLLRKRVYPLHNKIE